MLKIAVLIKRVPDTASVLTIREDMKSVELSGLKFVINPYDEHAVEEALRLRESQGGEVTAVCAGSAECMETVRTALAMGADSGVLITGAETLTTRGLAVALAAALQRISPDVIFAGKQAVDSDGSQTAERIAEIMGIPHASRIIHFRMENNLFHVECEEEGRQRRLAVEMPALFTVQKGINTPRYPTLPNIMKAKRKPVEEISVDMLSADRSLLEAGLSIQQLTFPRQERLKKILQGDLFEQIQALHHVLRNEEKVLQ